MRNQVSIATGTIADASTRASPRRVRTEKPAPDLLSVRQSPVAGRGVFATRSVGVGQVVGIYAGHRYASFDDIEASWDPLQHHFYGLSSGEVIDASINGGPLQFLNHSCEPNLVSSEVEIDGRLEVQFESIRAIGPGDEFSIDYQINPGTTDPSLYACRCGSSRCRGTMLAPPPEPAPAKRRRARL